MEYRLIAAALALLPLIAVALSFGRIFSTLIDSCARNPSTKDDLMAKALISFALTESIALLAFVVSMLILFS